MIKCLCLADESSPCVFAINRNLLVLVRMITRKMFCIILFSAAYNYFLIMLFCVNLARLRIKLCISL